MFILSQFNSIYLFISFLNVKFLSSSFILITHQLNVNFFFFFIEIFSLLFFSRFFCEDDSHKIKYGKWERKHFLKLNYPKNIDEKRNSLFMLCTRLVIMGKFSLECSLLENEVLQRKNHV